MLKNELKAALAMLGAACVPFAVQADQSMDNSQGAQQPGYQSGEMVRAGQLPGAYNQSATYMCDNGWDVFVTGDYIWWNWTQDTGLLDGSGNVSNVGTVLRSNRENMKPGYASGFQVGLGFNMHGMDDWNLYAEYTWYKNSGNSLGRTLIVDDEDTVLFATSDSSNARIKYDNLDFLLQRPFYFGKKLTATFATGLKALWISEKRTLNVDAVVGDLGDLFLLRGDLDLYRKVTSWGLGPKFGIDTSWLLGYGIKFLSNISASVLYTDYTATSDVGIFGDALDVFPFDAASRKQVSNYGTLRPIVETYLGLGWGSYFCDNNFHIDLSVGYDFNVFWNHVTKPVLSGMDDVGSLYLHGVNVQLRFDF